MGRKVDPVASTPSPPIGSKAANKRKTLLLKQRLVKRAAKSKAKTRRVVNKAASSGGALEKFLAVSSKCLLGEKVELSSARAIELSKALDLQQHELRVLKTKFDTMIVIDAREKMLGVEVKHVQWEELLYRLDIQRSVFTDEILRRAKPKAKNREISFDE